MITNDIQYRNTKAWITKHCVKAKSQPSRRRRGVDSPMRSSARAAVGLNDSLPTPSRSQSRKPSSKSDAG